MLLRIIFSWKNSPQWAASLFRRTRFTNLFSSRVVRPAPSWNECGCGRPDRPVVIRFPCGPLCSSIVLLPSLLSCGLICCPHCKSMLLVAIHSAQQPANTAGTLRTSPMWEHTKWAARIRGGKNPSSFRAVLFLHLKDILVTFLCPPFAGISVFTCLTRRLNAVCLMDKDLKDSLMPKSRSKDNE